MQFSKGAGENKLSGRLSHEDFRNLKPSDLASPRPGKSHGVTMPAALCNDEALKASADEIRTVREMVKAGEFPRAFMGKYYPSDWGAFPDETPAVLAIAHEKFALPSPLSFDDPESLAHVVHMDNPLDLGILMHRWLMMQGAAPKSHDTKHNDFLAKVPRAMAGMAAATAAALDKAFEIKYEFLVARPEEVWGENLTHYPEGCPTHPSYPAGHGFAAFQQARYFIQNWALTEDQEKALFDAAYVWSMARSFAGVHHGVDNLTNAPRRAEV